MPGVAVRLLGDQLGRRGPEGVAGQGEQARDVVLTAEDLAVEHRERARLLLRDARLLAATGGGVDDRGHGDGRDHEDQQGQEVVARGDVEGVAGRDEEVVEEQRAGHGGDERRPATTDEGDGDREAEVEHRLERRRGAAGVDGQQDGGERRRSDDREHPAEHGPARAEARGTGAVLHAPSVHHDRRGHGEAQPTCTCGRRSGSGSARRSTSRVTGATSPLPKSRNRRNCWTGLPSVQAK